MRVDLPAPLSPTSAVTLPAYALRLTPFSTLTGPKLFTMPESSMRGASIGPPPFWDDAVPCVMFPLGGSVVGKGPRAVDAIPARGPSSQVLLDAVLLAGGSDVTGAQLRCAGVAVVDHRLHLFRSHEHRSDRDVRGAVVERLVGRRLLTVQQLDGEVGCGLGLELERLVDRSGLLAQQHVLQARDRGVLTRDRNGEAVLVEDRDDTGGVRVVGRPDRVDLATERGQRLLEVGGRLLGVPDARRLGGRLDARGLHDRYGTVVEHLRVAIRGVAAHVHDDSGRRVLAGSLEAVDDRLALELADLHVVERHVVVSAGDRAVVGDDGHALRLGLLDDCRARTLVVDDEHDA